MIDSTNWSNPINFLGPNKQAQVVLVQGLVEQWQFPFFCDFDRKMTKELYMEFICALQEVGLEIHASTCDQGGANYGLMSELGITEDAPWIENPAKPDYFIFFLYDWVHVHKNLRNNLMDHILILPNGLRINAKHELKQLFKHCKDKEIGAGSFLKDILLECKNSDRQNVRFAEELMSNKTAALLRMIYPENAKRLALADLFDLIHQGYCHIHISLKPFKTFQNLSEPFRAFQNLSEPFRTFQSLSEPFRAFQNLSEPFRAFQNLSEPFRTFQNLSEPFRTFSQLLGLFSSKERYFDFCIMQTRKFETLSSVQNEY